MPDYTKPGAAAGGIGGKKKAQEGGSFGRTGVAALFSGGDIAGDTANIYGKDKVFGTKEKIAPYTPLDLTAEQLKSLKGNLSNADTIEGLLNRMVPGWSEMLKQGTGNATAELKGQIPKDVQEQIYRQSAFQALSGGFGGSGMAHALTARDLGRTSLDLTNMGNNAAQQWTKLAESSYSPFVTTTAEQANVTAANNAGEQATLQHQYNVDAAPDPAAAGMYAINSAIGQQLLSFGMGAAGGAMGGAGGAGAGAAKSGGTYNYAGQGANGQQWQYNSTTGQYAPILQAQRATWGGG